MTQYPNMVAVIGNTFRMRNALRAMGGRWDADRRVWMVPESKADEVKRLMGLQIAPHIETPPRHPGRVRAEYDPPPQ